MSNVDAPPNPYFNGINFNSSFFPSISAYLTEAMANSKYLKLIGGILRGNLGIKKTPAAWQALEKLSAIAASISSK